MRYGFYTTFMGKQLKHRIIFGLPENKRIAIMQQEDKLRIVWKKCDWLNHDHQEISELNRGCLREFLAYTKV